MCYEGNDNGAVATAFVVGLLLLLAFIIGSLLLTSWCSWNEGYMEGQIDILNGKQSIELQKVEDGSMKWTATQPAFHKWSDSKRFQVK